MKDENTKFNDSVGVRQQIGSALVISLILLAVISLLALSSSHRVNVDMKAVGSQRERGVAFQAAEAALSKVEQMLADSPPPIEMLWSGCVGDGCYTLSCNEGRCFGGKFDPTDTEYDCTTSQINPLVEPQPVWSDTVLDVWRTPGRHKIIDVESVNASVKYLVEFMCYVRKDQFTPFNADTPENKNNGVPLFRITALAESDGARASVALQSTFKILTSQ
jgi:type IV pilus assembly protein PilX